MHGSLNHKILGALLLFLHCSCKGVNPAAKDGQTNNTMNTGKFQTIDNKINTFAQSVNAKVYKDISGDYIVNGLIVPYEKIEERRIIWMDSLMGKTIVIQPSFKGESFDKPTWNFAIIAWQELDPSLPNHRREMLSWDDFLLKDTTFGEIEKNIELLLQTAKGKLDKIKREDLKGHGNNYY